MAFATARRPRFAPAMPVHSAPRRLRPLARRPLGHPRSFNCAPGLRKGGLGALAQPAPPLRATLPKQRKHVAVRPSAGHFVQRVSSGRSPHRRRPPANAVAADARRLAARHRQRAERAQPVRPGRARRSAGASHRAAAGFLDDVVGDALGHKAPPARSRRPAETAACSMPSAQCIVDAIAHRGHGKQSFSRGSKLQKPCHGCHNFSTVPPVTLALAGPPMWLFFSCCKACSAPQIFVWFALWAAGGAGRARLRGPGSSSAYAVPCTAASCTSSSTCSPCTCSGRTSSACSARASFLQYYFRPAHRPTAAPSTHLAATALDGPASPPAPVGPPRGAMFGLPASPFGWFFPAAEGDVDFPADPDGRRAVVRRASTAALEARTSASPARPTGVAPFSPTSAVCFGGWLMIQLAPRRLFRSQNRGAKGLTPKKGES